MTKLGLVFPGADLGPDVSGIRDYVQAAEDIRGLVTAGGRDPGAFGIDLIVPYPISPDEFATLADNWSDVGLSHMTLQVGCGAPSTAAEHIDLLREYANALT
jgi:hypothetical protein